MSRAASIACALSLAMILSCSEIPTAPRIPTTVTVSGRITDRDGPPLAGIGVYLAPEGQGSGYPAFPATETDADGRYTLKVSEGVYRFTLNSSSQGFPNVQLPAIKIGPSGATIDYRFAGVRVSGSIVGPNGEFMTNAGVYASGEIGGSGVYASGRSLNGQYSLLIPPGAYSFLVASDGYEDGLPRVISKSVPVASDTTIDFALAGFAVTAALTLSGAAPMIGGYVYATNDGVYAYGRAGLDGTATLYLPAGDYTIRAVPFPPNVVGPQTITRSIQADDALTFDFSGPEWDVTVRRASNGTPITGASAHLGDGEDGYAYATTDAFGRCAFLVRAGTGYGLSVSWVEGGLYRSATVSNLFSAADTTFDLSVTPAIP